jgi:hypothetical protein
MYYLLFLLVFLEPEILTLCSLFKIILRAFDATAARRGVFKVEVRTFMIVFDFSSSNCWHDILQVRILPILDDW